MIDAQRAVDAQIHPAIARLALYRLEADLSYDKLAARMRRAGCAVKVRSLHLALTRQVQPLERTLFRIEKFVSYHLADARAPARRKAKRRVRRSKAAA